MVVNKLKHRAKTKHQKLVKSEGFTGGRFSKANLLIFALLFAGIGGYALIHSSSAATLNATPSNLSSVYASAQGGDTILLASGSYGGFNGSQKSSMVTIQAAPGATVTMAGASFSGASNTTLKGIKFTSSSCVSSSSTNIVFDTDVFDNLGTGCNEGRLGWIQGSTGSVLNSHFGGGGCSDGLQISGGGGNAPAVAVIGNEFDNLRQGSCGPHVDALQFYGGRVTRLDNNYIHNISTGVMSFDSNGQVDEASNNVMVGDEYPWIFLLSGQHGGTFSHNVVIGEGFRIEGGHQNDAPTNNTVKDSVIDSLELIGGSGNVSTNNKTRSQVTIGSGTTRCAYATVSPKGTATDGTDIGLNNCSGTNPTPPPPPPPPGPTPPPTNPPPPPPNCTASSTAWMNNSFAAKTTTFSFDYDSTPQSTGIDAITGLGSGAATAYSSLAVIVRFNTSGTIDAVNGNGAGGNYTADATINYTAGTSYHFKITINPTSHTYSVVVTPQGGSATTIATNYPFRSEQATLSSFNNWTEYALSGSHTVCAATIGSGTTTKVGDLNADNKVDIFDMSILLTKYNTSGTSNADLNNDNIVNIFDLSILLSKYGT